MRRSSELRRVYHLPADRATKVFTGIGILITILVLLACFKLLSRLIGFITAIPLTLILIITYLYSPRRIVLKQDKIAIERVLGSVEIPYTKIKEISLVVRPKMLRLFGSGGFFGYFGLFSFEGETVHVYAKRMMDLVLIKADKTYLVAPDNPNEFITNLQYLIRKTNEKS